MIDLPCTSRNDFRVSIVLPFTVSGTISVQKRRAQIQILNQSFQVSIQPKQSNVEAFVFSAKRIIGDSAEEAVDASGSFAEFPRISA